MKKIILDTINHSAQVQKKFFELNIKKIEQTSQIFAKTLLDGNKILLFGNGGSAADCQHIAAEFVNRFQIERAPLPAIALTTDSSIITSIGNDYSFDDIFLKQLQALGNKKDIAIGISTSGNSKNVVKAIKEASFRELFTVCFCGNKGELKDICDIAFCVDSETTARIQEVHILLAHILCDLTERIVCDV